MNDELTTDDLGRIIDDGKKKKYFTEPAPPGLADRLKQLRDDAVLRETKRIAHVISAEVPLPPTFYRVVRCSQKESGMGYPRIEQRADGSHVIVVTIPLDECPGCGELMPAVSDCPGMEIQCRQQYKTLIKDRSAECDPKSGKRLCQDCASTVMFVCDHCGREWMQSYSEWSNKSRDATYHLCSGCYDTLTAKEWDKAKTTINDKVYADDLENGEYDYD